MVCSISQFLLDCPFHKDVFSWGCYSLVYSVRYILIGPFLLVYVLVYLLAFSHGSDLIGLFPFPIGQFLLVGSYWSTLIGLFS